MPRTVIGIDGSSTRLAAIALDGPTMHTETLRLPSDITGACIRATEWVQYLVAEFDPTLIVVEAPFIHRANPTGAIGMAQVNGALLSGTTGKQVVSVQPSHWKKSVLGKGSASKPEIYDWVKEHHTAVHDVLGDRPMGGDLLDAFCIALHGLHVIAIRDRIVLAQ